LTQQWPWVPRLRQWFFTAGSGAYQHFKMKNVDGDTAVLVGYSGVLGVILGSIVFGYLKPYEHLIDLIVGVAFLLPSVRMLYEGLVLAPRQARLAGAGGQGAAVGATAPKMPGSPVSKSVLGSIIGFLTGIIGLAGGYALVPAFLYVLRGPMKLAVGTSMASFTWMALVGATFKLYQHVVDVPTAICLGIGAVIGALYGARLVARVKTATLKALFGAIFIYVAAKYILIYFGIAIWAAEG